MVFNAMRTGLSNVMVTIGVAMPGTMPGTIGTMPGTIGVAMPFTKEVE